MAIFQPLILDVGEVRQLAKNNTERIVDGNVIIYLQNDEATLVSTSEVMYINSSTGKLKRAKADSIITAKAAFLAVEEIASGAFGPFQMGGVIHTSLGFAPDNECFLSATTAGAITTTPPATPGHFITRIGLYMIADRLVINIQPPIKRG